MQGVRLSSRDLEVFNADDMLTSSHVNLAPAPLRSSARDQEYFADDDSAEYTKPAVFYHRDPRAAEYDISSDNLFVAGTRLCARDMEVFGPSEAFIQIPITAAVVVHSRGRDAEYFGA